MKYIIILLFVLLLPSANKNQTLVKLEEVIISAEEDRKSRALTHIKAGIQAYFEEAQKNGSFIGAAVSVVTPDDVLFQNGFGYASIKNHTFVDENTVFRLGSVSKSFAGVLSALLVNENAISWDDRIYDYIPEFGLANKNYEKKITLHHLLSQSSGLPYHSYSDLIEKGIPLEKVAGAMANIKALDAPGTVYNYQNAAYALSGVMLEKAACKPLEELLEEKVFSPLGMIHASSSYEAIYNEENVAYPHINTKRGWVQRDINKKYYNAVLAGGINASISDMSKWLQFLLSDGIYQKDSNVEEVFTPKIKDHGRYKYYHRWPGIQNSSYGYGWRIHELKKNNEYYNIIHHGGFVNGYRSEIAFIKEKGIGICVLVNNANNFSNKVIPDLLAIIDAYSKVDKGVKS